MSSAVATGCASAVSKALGAFSSSASLALEPDCPMLKESPEASEEDSVAFSSCSCLGRGDGGAGEGGRLPWDKGDEAPDPG